MKQITLAAIITMLFTCAQQSQAVIVELPLDAAGVYTGGLDYWEADFDLGVTFSEISNVYIDWSGEIMAATKIDSPGDTPVPIDLDIMAGFGGDATHYAFEHAGKATYPQPEPFAEISEFMLSGLDTWDDLLDGKGTMFIYASYPIIPGSYVDFGYVQLDNATFIVDGTVIPEPATITLFVLGAAFIGQSRRRYYI